MRALVAFVSCVAFVACADTGAAGPRVERPSASVSGEVRVFASWSPDKLRVALGRTWVLPGATISSPVSPDRSFLAPADRQALTVFLDVDGDTKLDLLREPANHCTFDGSWRCHLFPQRVVVHGVASPNAPEGSAQITFESYDPRTAEPSPWATLCDVETNTCAEGGDLPYEAESPGARSIADCGAQGGPARSIRVASPSIDRVVAVSSLPSMDLEVDAHRERNGDIRLTAHTSVRADRALLWIATSNGEIYWTSEAVEGSVMMSDTRVEMRASADDIRNCGGCWLVVQVASVQVGSDVGEPTRVAEAHWSRSTEDL